MTVSRVNHSLPTPVVEDKTNGTPDKQRDPHRSRQPAPPVPQGQDASDHLPDQKAARANLLANSERGGNASGTRKTSGPRHKESTNKPWNTGLTAACELVQTLAPPGMSASANHLLQEFEKMIRPLTTAVQTFPAATLLTDAIDWLWTIGSTVQDNEDAAASARPNADLLKKLEDLKADDTGFNALGFYAVMNVMSAASGIAESIKKDITDEHRCAQVNRQVLSFAHHIASRLKTAFPSHANSPQKRQLVTMTKASMVVPFQYLHGRGMQPSLSHSMMIWRRTAYGRERQAPQRTLEEALGCFLDAHIDPPE